MKRILVLMLLFVVGCSPVFIVRKNGAGVDGIPFYIKTARCLHQSVYVLSYYQITFQKLKDDKVYATETITISSKAYEDKTVQHFLALMRKSPSLDEADLLLALADWSSISKLSKNPYEQVTADDAEWPKYLVANSSAPTVLVDYSNQYTLNAKSPFAGTVNADYKLNEDGTLSEASGQIQEQTLSTVLSALPVADLIKTAASILVKGKTETFTLQAAIEKHFLKVTRSQFKNFQVGCGTNGDVVTGQFDTLIEDVVGKSITGTKSSGTADDNSIKINGTVTGTVALPKSSGTAATPNADSGSKTSKVSGKDSGSTPATPDSGKPKKGSKKPKGGT